MEWFMEMWVTQILPNKFKVACGRGWPRIQTDSQTYPPKNKTKQKQTKKRRNQSGSQASLWPCVKILRYVVWKSMYSDICQFLSFFGEIILYFPHDQMRIGDIYGSGVGGGLGHPLLPVAASYL